MNKLTEQEKHTVYNTALHISLELCLLSVSATFSSKPVPFLSQNCIVHYIQLSFCLKIILNGTHAALMFFSYPLHPLHLFQPTLAQTIKTKWLKRHRADPPGYKAVSQTLFRGEDLCQSSSIFLLIPFLCSSFNPR